MSQIHYLPLTPGFFAILVGIFIIVLILRSVRYAYESLGVTSCAAMFLLFATLVGSMFNVPIAELPPERIVSHEVIHFFGMRYQVPVVTHWAGTVIAVNVGGAVECAPNGGHLAELELTRTAGLSEDESHGQAPLP